MWTFSLHPSLALQAQDIIVGKANMADPNQDNSNRYMTDIVNLCVSLDMFITRNDSERITRELIEGKEEYFDLVFRRLLVDFPPNHAAVALWMLDIVQVQLATMARLQYGNAQSAGVPDGTAPGAFALDG